MASKGNQGAEARKGGLRLLGWPVRISLLLHLLACGGALWWAAQRPPPAPTLRIGSIELRDVDEESAVPPEEALVEPPPLDETYQFADALEHVVIERPPEDVEPVFDDPAPPPPRPAPVLDEPPLTAGRRPAPVLTPRPPPRPVRAPQPPAVRPPVVRLRPVRPPPPSPPRVAPSPSRRTPLRVVWAPDPRRYYPATALRRGLGGRTLVRLTIDASGRVTHARIERTSGHAELDRAAVSLAYAYRFTAGTGLRSTRLPVTFRPPAGGFGS